jgi:hypothetical protein
VCICSICASRSSRQVRPFLAQIHHQPGCRPHTTIPSSDTLNPPSAVLDHQTTKGLLPSVPAHLSNICILFSLFHIHLSTTSDTQAVPLDPSCLARSTACTTHQRELVYLVPRQHRQSPGHRLRLRRRPRRRGSLVSGESVSWKETCPR